MAQQRQEQRGGQNHLPSLWPLPCSQAGTLILTWVGGSSEPVYVPVGAAGRTAVPVAGRPFSGPGIGMGLSSGTGMPVCPSTLPSAAPETGAVRGFF